MKSMFLILVFTFVIVGFSGLLADDDLLFAEYPPQPTGCCMKRDWLAAQWNKSRLNFGDCAALNRSRDGLDNLFEEKGYVWWDSSCNL